VQTDDGTAYKTAASAAFRRPSTLLPSTDTPEDVIPCARRPTPPATAARIARSRSARLTAAGADPQRVLSRRGPIERKLPALAATRRLFGLFAQFKIVYSRTEPHRTGCAAETRWRAGPLSEVPLVPRSRLANGSFDFSRYVEPLCFVSLCRVTGPCPYKITATPPSPSPSSLLFSLFPIVLHCVAGARSLNCFFPLFCYCIVLSHNSTFPILLHVISGRHFAYDFFLQTPSSFLYQLRNNSKLDCWPV
jgi:hypothetical protein